ncbi:MAG: 3-deoxy-7-phosphoheptulonate synthase [Deltaproteobacteria bacterium]|nr:3-deoxy-7-phosphoheptulonate synthase [Deltaproteobacteria bacterium]
MFQNTDDVRIEKLRPLIPPAILMEELPVTTEMAATVATARQKVADCLNGVSDKLVVVVGPCSIHDTKAALEYAGLLKGAIETYEDELVLLMRVYFEKPRTTVGWKGLINDPEMNGSFNINNGLRTARQLLSELTQLGIPAGTEFLDTITPQFIADLVSWGAIGARTTESQIHRELASGLSMPVGFKNGTDGNTDIAVAAIGAANHPHNFLSVTKQSLAAIVSTKGNPNCHVILRGSSQGTNYDSESVAQAVAKLQKADVTQKLMVDCSHGNSQKDHNKQPLVADDVAKQVAAGGKDIFGLMVESHINEGRQNLKAGETLSYGQSITDACLGRENTQALLENLAEAVRKRRQG